MNLILSKTLRRHLDMGRVEAKRNTNAVLIKDIAFLSIVKEGMSHATHILHKMLDETQMHQLRMMLERQVVQGILAGMDKKGNTLQQEYARIVEGVAAAWMVQSGQQMLSTKTAGGKEPVGVANTGHFLAWVLTDGGVVAMHLLKEWNVSLDKVTEYVRLLPPDEDYYTDIDMLGKSQEKAEAKARIRIEESDQEESESKTEASPTQRSRSRSRSFLDKYGVNLSQQAAQGEIDPVIGRQKEIERLIQILGRRKKNNPILVGEAGVGKSALVEGLALRIANGDVPHALCDKEIFSLDIASLIAGTKYRGEFEERIKELLAELKRREDIILFIDEIHTIVGSGSTQGSLDTANILKPALARGEIQCIGATTLDEYRECIENDGALERRFQKVIVEPTSAEETLRILEHIRPGYELHHSVRYTDEALKACVELTGRYVTDRHFPDKAIDAMDEAGSKARLFGVREPGVVRQMEHALNQLDEQLKKGEPTEGDSPAKVKVRIMALRRRIKECRAEWQRELSLNPVEVDVHHIEETITSMTGIPVEKVSQGEKKRLANMEKHLCGSVIGQDQAVSRVVKSIQRSRTGLKDPNKPIGVFMFVGPTGVGKTHLAKQLSRWMFDSEGALISIDMSEYSEKHNVSRMIGSPPGYVGYNEGGQLSEAVRRQPYSVVLFDEIEKAHPDVFNIMLQIFDEGHLTDGNGRKIDFRNTIIIMTSNVGTRQVAERPKAIGYVKKEAQPVAAGVINPDYRSALERTFAPEFINRIDDIVVFNTLDSEQARSIVDLELKGFKERCAALGYTLAISARARRRLAELGYNDKYGVRSLKRVILRQLEEPVAQMIVEQRLSQGQTVKVDTNKGDITVEVVEPEMVLRKSS